MNLYEKIVEVRKSIGSLNKDKQGYQFSYVTGDQILGKIKHKMDELGLILQPSTQAGEWSRHDYKNSKGKDKIDFLVWGQASYTWINAEKPEEREQVSFAYFGQQGDDLSQAYGTALTYAERYFLLKYFGIPTDDDDADARRYNNRPDPAPQQNYNQQQQNYQQQNRQPQQQNYNKQQNYNQPQSGGCASCGADVPDNVKKYSMSKFKKVLCYNCQKQA